MRLGSCNTVLPLWSKQWPWTMKLSTVVDQSIICFSHKHHFLTMTLAATTPQTSNGSWLQELLHCFPIKKFGAINVTRVNLFRCIHGRMLQFVSSCSTLREKLHNLGRKLFCDWENTAFRFVLGSAKYFTKRAYKFHSYQQTNPGGDAKKTLSAGY